VGCEYDWLGGFIGERVRRNVVEGRRRCRGCVRGGEVAVVLGRERNDDDGDWKERMKTTNESDEMERLGSESIDCPCVVERKAGKARD